MQNAIFSKQIQRPMLSNRVTARLGIITDKNGWVIYDINKTIYKIKKLRQGIIDVK